MPSKFVPFNPCLVQPGAAGDAAPAAAPKAVAGMRRQRPMPKAAPAAVVRPWAPRLTDYRLKGGRFVKRSVAKTRASHTAASAQASREAGQQSITNFLRDHEGTPLSAGVLGKDGVAGQAESVAADEDNDVYAATHADYVKAVVNSMVGKAPRLG